MNLNHKWKWNGKKEIYLFRFLWKYFPFNGIPFFLIIETRIPIADSLNREEEKNVSRNVLYIFPSDFSCLSICPSTKLNENGSDGTYQVENL